MRKNHHKTAFALHALNHRFPDFQFGFGVTLDVASSKIIRAGLASIARAMVKNDPCHEHTHDLCEGLCHNRVYDDALLKLGDILIGDGCLPIAPDRPDPSDLALAQSFGRKIKDKLLVQFKQ